MQEIQPGQEGVPETPPAEEKNAPVMRDAHQQGSREPLWGMFLIAFMLLFVIASIAGIGWVVYSKWQSVRVAKNEPSIMALSEQPLAPETAMTESAQENTEAAAPQGQSDSAGLEAAKKLEISVLNGGAAKGSAGVLAEFLKTEGYSKVIAGNTAKDYAGIAIYHAANLEKEANAIRGSVAKKYPQVKVLPADTANKETTTFPVTIIIGK